MEYDNAIVLFLIGVISRSIRIPLALSCTISKLEQNDTVIQLTASKEETSCAATHPSIKEDDTLKIDKLSSNIERYVPLKKVPYNTSNMIGVIKDVKNIPKTNFFILYYTKSAQKVNDKNGHKGIFLQI